MNVNMWQHPATQANLETLAERNVQHRAARQRIPRLRHDRQQAASPKPARSSKPSSPSLHHRNDLAGETVLVTAGGTREALDPVRFLGNRSSGKMGYALAEAAERRGARVILVTAPTALRPPANCEVVPVITTDEMREAVLEPHGPGQHRHQSRSRSRLPPAQAAPSRR